MSILALSMQASEQKETRSLLVRAQLATPPSSSSPRASSQLQPRPAHESFPSDSDQIASPETQTPVQKLAELDGQAESYYHSVPPAQQKVLARIAQHHDPNERCCCHPWRTYKPKFEGLSDRLISPRASHDWDAAQFNIPELQEYRTQEKMAHDAYYGNLESFSQHRPTNINLKRVGGRHLLFSIVTDDYLRDLRSSLYHDEKHYPGLEQYHNMRRAAILEKAVELGLDLDVQDNDGNTGLHHAACQSSQVATALVNSLIKKGHLANQLAHRNQKGETPLVAMSKHKKVFMLVPHANNERRTRMSIYLLSLGASPDIADNDGNSFTSLSRNNVELEYGLAVHEKQQREAAQKPVIPQNASVVSVPSPSGTLGCPSSMAIIVPKP